MKVLIDTNVLLDYLVNTPNHLVFRPDAQRIWDAQVSKKFEGFVSAISVLNVFYIAKKANANTQSLTQALVMVREILSTFQILPVDTTTLQQSLYSPFKDYEDAVQHASAVIAALDAIVTRDVKDFAKATIPVYTPEQFINILFPNNP